MMKNKILGMVSIAFIAVLTAINVNFTSLENENVELASLSLISTANAEDGQYAGWGNFWQGQGFYKDERELPQPCYNETSWNANGGYGGATAGGGVTNSGSNGAQEIDCAYGSENCSWTWC